MAKSIFLALAALLLIFAQESAALKCFSGTCSAAGACAAATLQDDVTSMDLCYAYSVDCAIASTKSATTNLGTYSNLLTSQL